MGTLVFEPVVPVSAVLALILVATLMVGAYHTVRPPHAPPGHRLASGALGYLALLILGVLLLNPSRVDPLPRAPGNPVLDVLVDTSASMATADVDGRSRLEAASRFARDLRTNLRAGTPAFDVRLLAFDQRVRPVSEDGLGALGATGEVTDLAAAVRGALELPGAQAPAMVILSDGIHNATPSADAVLDAARAARAIAAPIHVWPLGGDVSVVDLAVELDSAQELALAGQAVTLRARIAFRGVKSGVADARLLHLGQVVARASVSLSGKSPAPVSFTLTAPEPGVQSYTVAVAPLSGEVVLTNNSRELALNVIDEPIRVLILEGKPYWDLKFLTRALTQDLALLPTEAVRLAGDRVLVRTVDRPAAAGRDAKTRTEDVHTVSLEAGTLPDLADPVRLARFQVVVLGRDAESFLTPAAMASLKLWISRQGGTLVCARGRPSTEAPAALEPLMPVEWETSQEMRFRMRMTGEGRALGLVPESLLPSFEESQTSLAGAARVAREKEMATVLARAQIAGTEHGGATLSVQPYGLGRTVVVEGTGMWRMALAPMARAGEESAYRAFWAGLIRWAVLEAQVLPGRPAGVRPSKGSYTTLEPVTLYVVARAEAELGPAHPPRVTVEGDPAGPRHLTAAPAGAQDGVYRAELGRLPAGRYVARVELPAAKSVEARFVVGAPDIERIELSARRDLLARLASQTGGVVLASPDTAALRDACLGYWSAVHPPRYRRTLAWDRPAVLLTIVGLWAVAWILRRHGGLV